MMSPTTWPYLLLLSAIALMVFEVFIPSGGVLGALSAIAFIAAVAASFFYGGLQLGTYFLVGTSVLIPALIYVSIKLWPRTPFGKRILNQPASAEEMLPANIKERKLLIGRRGLTTTPMLPSGVVRIDGRTIDAISDGVAIEKGSPVEVMAIRGNYLVVRLSRASHNDPDANEATTGSGTNSAPNLETRLNDVIQDPFDDSLS